MNEPALEPPPEGLSQARARLIATPIILAVLGGILWVHDATGVAVGTHLLLAVFGAAAGAEMSLLFKAAGRPARPLEAAVWCGLLCLVGMDGPAQLPMARPLLLMLAVVTLLVRHMTDTRPAAVESIATRLIPIVFVGFLLSFMAEFAGDARLVVWVVLTAKASDMAGWAIGVPFGKHKMIPSVSPGKSWEGTVAGVAASVLTAVLLPRVLGLSATMDSTLRLALAGFVIGAASILAGVLWSGWKRRLGAKDSSALIPAMGGVMDMVDSLLLAGPALHLFGLFVRALS